MWISGTRGHRIDPDASPCGMAMFGDDGRVLAANDTLLQWLQPGPAGLEGLTLEALLAPGARDQLHAVLMPALRQRGRIDGVSLALRPLAGDDLDVVASVSRRESTDGPVIHAVFTRRVGGEAPGADLAPQAECENQQLRMTGMLAAGIAHDFNNLLGSINGLAELCLLEAAGQPRLERNLRRIREGGRKAAVLVRQMLDFARQSPQVFQRVSMRGLLMRGREGLEALLPPGVTLEIGAPEDIVLRADPVQLEQALQHLVHNAGDAMRDRGGAVRVLLERVRAGSLANPLKTEAARVDVIDAGCGIAPEHLPDIFQPFFTTKEVGQGTGLGLAAVHGIVGSHAGRVQVESRPGAGSRFSVWIPVTPPGGDDAQDLAAH